MTDLGSQIDAAASASCNSFGRRPCRECVLKHLGIAWFLADQAPREPAVLLERARILVDESVAGYLPHRYLAAGILGFMEPFSHDRAKAREIRRAVAAGAPADLSEYPLPGRLPPPSQAMRQAHLVEASHESAEPLPDLPELSLVERILNG